MPGPRRRELHFDFGARFTVELLRRWKQDAEARALRDIATAAPGTYRRPILVVELMFLARNPVDRLVDRTLSSICKRQVRIMLSGFPDGSEDLK